MALQLNHQKYKQPTSMKKPFISIVTINYGQSKVTNQLLDSLQKLTWPNFEILIVDNNSENEDYKHINTAYSNTQLIRSDYNRGFAGGNNLGIKYAKGDYILLLNNDTEVVSGFIEPMVEIFDNEPDAGIVSPKIKFFYNPNYIQYAGFTPMNPFTLRMNAIGSKKNDDGSFDTVNETPFAHGCAMMIRADVIRKVGLMPEEYFLYYEEHDWSTSIRRAGYKIFYQPKSVVFHKESISVQKSSPLKTYYLNRNRILYMRRNFSVLNRIASWTYLLLVSIPVNLVRYILASDNKHLKAYRSAILWNFRDNSHIAPGLKTF